MMRNAMESHANNIQSGANPRAVEEYSKRAGIKSLSQLLGKGPTLKGPPTERQRRIQELKAKLGGG
jgi:hypothetical protein